MYSYFSLLIIFIFSLNNCFASSWIENWNEGIKLAKQKKFSQSIEAYDKAIKESPQDRNHLYLYNERGNVHLQKNDFDKAASDFSFVINYPNVSKEDLMEALKKRGQTFLLLGKPKQFMEDCNRLDKIEPLFQEEDTTPDYQVIKLGSMVLKDPNAFNEYTEMYLLSGDIESKTDVTQTPSGRIILKKKSSTAKN